MQIRQLKIQNFRGIGSLEWAPSHSFCCLIGPGDSGKSTILDAAEAALSSRWFAFSEPDFFGCDTSKEIVIEATIGELSRALKSDERFGLFVRGWTSTGTLRDEPEDDDEPVLTVRLTVDGTMEPAWELVRETLDAPRTLSNRDRALFGLVRLAGDDARHLTWGQNSVLSRLTGDTDEAAGKLAEAYRAARESAKLHEIESLAEAAKLAERFAKGLGAYIDGHYHPGLELGRSGLSTGSIALHDGGVPLRLAGLGSRRLATLALQKTAVEEGAIVLVDEIEHGLEPHRIIGAISQLKADQTRAAAERKPLGQILMTTHNDVALAEAGENSLQVVRTSRPGRAATTVVAPSPPASIQPILRFAPRALFGRKVLVCEGNTELGILLGVREFWPGRHDEVPIEQLGSAICDGNGGQACAIALQLSKPGYETALYRDSDDALSGSQLAALAAARVPIFEYGDGVYTELASFEAASDQLVQELLDFARDARSPATVDDNLAIHISDVPLDAIRMDFDCWFLVSDKDGQALREGIAHVAAAKHKKEKKDKKPWFKDQRVGRELSTLVWAIALEAPESRLAKTLAEAEAWLHA